MVPDLFEQRFAKLNPEQKLAVETLNGPVMVVAGPGTGKTELLALRICNIIRQKKAEASQILALTFTESGVKAMKERLTGMLGPLAYKVTISTFHGFCNSVIQENSLSFMSHKELELMTELERYKLVQKIIEELENGAVLKPFGNPLYYLSTVLSRIGKLKQEDISPDMLAAYVKKKQEEFAEIPEEEKVNQSGRSKGKVKGKYLDMEKDIQKLKELSFLYRRYQEECTRLGRYYFEDMLMSVAEAFRKDDALLQRYSERFTFILVDEYQDTNSTQNDIVSLLVEGSDAPNLFVVGDDDQAIYRFQGASMENIMHFHRVYPQLKVIVLKKNYRSTQVIIDAALSFIGHNIERLPRVLPEVKKEFSAARNEASQKVSVAKLSCESAEYFYVLEKIKELHAGGVAYKDIAVMYRNNRDVLPLVELFKAARVPFELSMDIDVLENRYVEILLSFFRAVDDPHRDNDLFKYLYSPACHIDNEDLFAVSEYMYRHKQGLFEVLDSSEHRAAIGLKNEKALMEVLGLIKALHAEKYDLPFADLAVRMLHRSNVFSAVLAVKDNIFDLNQVNSFIAWLREQQGRRPGFDIKALLSDIAFMKEAGLSISAQEIYANSDGVNLMTAHGSKGLEFPCVFILRCTSQNWESHRNNDYLKLPVDLVIKEEKELLNNDKVEDARRLFYVACTRAKDRLFCTYPDKRDDGNELSISGFLIEMDIAHRVEEDMSAYEQKFSERVALQLSERTDAWKEDVSEELLKRMVRDHVMNPTALNNYLKCPAYFKYNNLFRIPGEYNKFSALGSCIHSVLEIVFRQAAQSKKMADWSHWERLYLAAAEKVVLPKAEKEAVLHEGLSYIKGYYEHYRQSFHIDCLTEFNFHSHDVRFDGIPITGKLDKIELLPGNKARVIDYKTGKPQSRNAIMGMTESSEGDYFRQLVFYKLLAECDQQFPYEVIATAIDFVQPKENGTFIREEFEILPENVDALKVTVKDVHQKIRALDFKPTDDTKKCRQYDKECEYAALCGRKS